VSGGRASDTEQPGPTAGPPTARLPTARARGPLRAVDPRLLRYTKGTRRFLVLTVALGGVTAALVLAQAWLIATTVSDVVVHHRSLSEVLNLVILLALAVLARATVAWLGERMADRASASAKSELRSALAARIAALGPAAVESQPPGRLVVLSTKGIDALDAYFARYLPQLFLAVIVPVSVVVVVLGADWVSALIIAVTLPLIPLFLSLVGASTAARMRRQALLLQRLAGHFLEMVAGLPTLKVFGRAKAQVAAVTDVTDQYRTATMATLNVAFLSSLILELLATVSVALVAVSVGLRLLGGHLGLGTALFVLILAPEAYLPLRQLGATHHASAEGIQAIGEVVALLEQPLATTGGRRDVPDPTRSAIEIDNLEVCYPGRTVPALSALTLSVRPGEILAVAGPSGCGKSTLLNVLLGMAPSWTGSVRVGGTDLRDLDPDAWRSHLAWVPQRPHLFARSIADNVRLGRADASDQAVTDAIAAAGLDEVVAALPDGLDTVLGHGGAGLSAGERQRVALARAFVRDAPILLLDEPTAGLDGRTESAVLAAVRRLIEGRTVILVAHRPSLLAEAHRVVRLAPVVAASA
jgi:ATP-binding cassette, subfamily C, bacterial CydCD